MKPNMTERSERLKLELKDLDSISYFVETGTNVGQTAEWASIYFENVTTIEFEEQIYEQAIARRGDIDNIDFRCGNSKNELKSVLDRLKERAIIYLDAHRWEKWEKSLDAADKDTTEKPLCPLSDELAVICADDLNHIIFIDDSRFFTNPEYTYFYESWPSIQEIIHTVESADRDYYVMIYEDEIVAIPPDLSRDARRIVAEEIPKH